MLNNFIYYYIIFILTLICINLSIKLGRYLYYYFRNKYLYNGSNYKLIDPNYKSYKHFFIFTPRSKETIFRNYYNMLKIVLNYLYSSNLFEGGLHLIFYLYNTDTKLYEPLSDACFINLMLKSKPIQVFSKIR